MSPYDFVMRELKHRHHVGHFMRYSTAREWAALAILDGFGNRESKIDLQDAKDYLDTFADREIIGYTYRGYEYGPQLLQWAIDWYENSLHHVWPWNARMMYCPKDEAYHDFGCECVRKHSYLIPASVRDFYRENWNAGA